MTSLALKYAVFAGISTAVNLTTQYLSMSIYSKQYGLYAAIFTGTLTGLIVKFILDKRFIFYYQTKTSMENIYKFILYTLMGVATTLIFWGFEILFNHFLKIQQAKYIGAIIGLTIGYLIKYNLDKRFVFINVNKGWEA